MRVLHLTLKRRFFDEIASGDKQCEFREVKPYYRKRLDGKSFDEVHFRNGYSRNAPFMHVEFKMQLEVITREPESDARSTPILFVHGYWHAAWCWSEHFLPYFAQHGYESHALSLRGHGNSDGYEKIRWTPLTDFVADVVQIANQLKRPPVLVGHSMGGMIVQKYLESHQAPAVVLLASAPPKGVMPLALRIFTRYPLPFLKANLTLRTYHVVAAPDRYRSILFSENLPGEELVVYHAHLKDDSYRAFMDMMFLDLPRPKKVNSTPMLVLGSTDDFIVSSSEVEGTARTYGTQAELFSGMGHAMMLDVGWQATTENQSGGLRSKAPTPENAWGLPARKNCLPFWKAQIWETVLPSEDSPRFFQFKESGSPPVECCWPRMGGNGVETPGFSPNKAVLVPETCSTTVI